MRSFWKGDGPLLPAFASRVLGSSDLFERRGRKTWASVNFITAHDGFTLNDLVSYNDKHNEANGEDNRDGDNNNHSWNHGAEGPADGAEINQLRLQQRRNFLTTLFLSQGVPMLTAGDEWARTQQGNNNAYCQDNEISWLNWNLEEDQKELLEFTRSLIRLRHEHPVFRRPKFFQGRRIRGSEIRDVMWFNPGGNEMSDDEWNSPFVRCLGMLLSGDTIDVQSFEGEPIRDDTFLLVINAHHEPLQFVLPGQKAVTWQLLLDTASEDGFCRQPQDSQSGDEMEIKNRSTILLKLVTGSTAQARHESWKKRQFAAPHNGEAPKEKPVQEKTESAAEGAAPAHE
ncbi:MAG: hypothetical protein H0T83_07605 [Chthoniobacterales bacterium]|nr:hypothetical protein [Chthoniobacterales bacterium]